MELSQKVLKYTEFEYKNYINTSNLQELHTLKLYLDDMYYNTSDHIIDDKRYDILKDTLTKRDPNYIPPVGCKIRENENRVTLPFWMGSVNKTTPEDENDLTRWVSNNPCKEVIITEKLDGVSGMFIQKNGTRKLYTRGDGVIGADISYLIQYISNIPQHTEDIALRGELIIEKKTFDSEYKYDGINRTKNTYKHSRNMVAGIIGAKTLRNGIKDIKFIVYEIVSDNTSESPLNQLDLLTELGYTTAIHKSIQTEKLSIETLITLHKKFKKHTNFEIDGIIVQSNVKYDRNISGNPSYLFAFKMNGPENIVETTVLDIDWRVSKWGQIVPVAIIDPVDLPGVTISKVTLSNAGLMVEKRIGIGSVVNVTRSKDVIPFIVDVITECNEEDLNFPEMPYEWDDNKVHLNVIWDKIDDETADFIKIKMFSSFFDKMGIKHVSEQTVKKIYNGGFNTLLKIVGMTKKELMENAGFKDKSATRIIDNIKNGLQNINTIDLLGASGVLGYGIGRKKVKALMNDIPDLLVADKNDLKHRIMKVEGFSEITANKVVDRIDNAIEFIDEISKYVTFAENTRTSNVLVGKKFVFSGFRSRDLEVDIQNKGGVVSTSVSKKTTAVIVSNKNTEKTGKVSKAVECNVPIYEKEEFIEKFLK